MMSFPTRWTVGSGAFGSALQANAEAKTKPKQWSSVTNCLLGGSDLFGLGSVHVHTKSQSCAPNLVLKSQANELGLILLECLGESRGTLRTHRPTTVFKIAEMGARNGESFRKNGQAFFF